MTLLCLTVTMKGEEGKGKGQGIHGGGRQGGVSRMLSTRQSWSPDIAATNFFVFIFS